MGCVEPAGGEYEAPDHEAAGYGEQTGGARASPATFAALWSYGDVRQQADAILDRLQPASCRATAPGRYRTLTCSNAGSAPAMELTWPDRAVPLRRNPAARLGRRNTVWCRVR